MKRTSTFPVPAAQTNESLIVNRLRQIRMDRGISQGEMAVKVGMTRQALYAMEMNQYLPGTALALKLAQVLGCAVEDLFQLEDDQDIIQATYVGEAGHGSFQTRVKLGLIGRQVIARPIAELGSTLNYMVPADGLVVGKAPKVKGQPMVRDRVCVKMLRSQHAVESQIIIGGCDPAIFLVDDHLRHGVSGSSVVAWTMGSVSALRALNRGEIHVAGIHMVDHASGAFNVPFLRKYVKGLSVTVVRFAAWQEGILTRRGNPKRIRGVEDFARADVRIVNREKGSGARLLLDHLLASQRIPATGVRGYDVVCSSQIRLGQAIAEGRGDAGIGAQAVAHLHDLHFIPMQDERYDLVIPSSYLHSHPAMRQFLDALVTKRFRQEIDALGGYDTKEIGNIIQ